MNGQNYIQIVTDTIQRAAESQREALFQTAERIAKTNGYLDASSKYPSPVTCHL